MAAYLSGFALQEVSAGKDAARGAALLLCRSLQDNLQLGRGAMGRGKNNEPSRMETTLVGQDFLLGKEQVN